MIGLQVFGMKYTPNRAEAGVRERELVLVRCMSELTVQNL